MPVLLATAGVVQQSLMGQLPAATVVAGAVFVGTVLCWRFGLIGGGDVKLLSAGSLLVAPAMVPDLLIATALAGALLAVAYISLRPLLRDAPVLARVPRARPLPARILATERRRIRRQGPLPYACAIAAGMGVTLFGG
jgi:prepilin peptidase CpaA